MRHRLGFMQGRLVDQVDGKIQCFPGSQWRDEFPAAQQLGLESMEWTLDAEGLSENPLCTEGGRLEIRSLSARCGVQVPSLTGDCFMQQPFWKSGGLELQRRLNAFDTVIHSAAEFGVRHVVIPLVDNGRLESREQEGVLLRHLTDRLEVLRSGKVCIAFESDFAPPQLAEFIAQLPSDSFGINYDTGNSASLGYSPREEFAAYGRRVCNVHIKDRVLGGTTVPLGEGNADFNAAFESLAVVQYEGNIVLQTARAQDRDHAQALGRYADFTRSLMEVYFGP